MSHGEVHEYPKLCRTLEISDLFYKVALVLFKDMFMDMHSD